MRIPALEVWGMNLMDDASSSAVIDVLPPVLDSSIELDLSGCILDYPGTSRIVDAVLDRLASLEPPRTLTIVFDIPFYERHFNKSLFFGSTMLPSDYHSLKDADIRELVKQHLQNRGISLRLRIVDAVAGSLVQEWIYG